jgi:hypothetical protein
VLFNPTLMETNRPFYPVDFNSCINARGMYESQRFVLRLSPVIHRLVNEIVEARDRGTDDITSEGLQAYSTYIHETVHWWQHKGSTSGFVRSMLYPTQTSGNMDDLKKINSLIGPKKSIKAVAQHGEHGLLKAWPGAAELANVVTNNFMDTQFYLALTHTPNLSESIYHDPYFEAAGHSFLITYVHVLGALMNLFDPNGIVFPDPHPISENLLSLRAAKTDGYYVGSPIYKTDLGLLHIMEGQARFIQLQFLAFTIDGITLSAAKNDGMLDGEYGQAFKVFLRLTESTEPEFIDDPLIALFLLICDFSLNPCVGFLSPILNYENFFLDADPGVSFMRLCRAVAQEVPELREVITEYSHEQYLEVVEKLAKASGLESPLEALAKVPNWENQLYEVSSALKEHQNLKFEQANVVPRVLLAEFIEFTKDKLKRPDFFCWAGYWKASGKGGKEEMALWLKNLSLFSDREDDGGIFGRNFPGCLPKDIKNTADQFYASIILYDLTTQWVLKSGPFERDFRWLTSKPNAGFQDRVNDLFKKYYNAGLDEFEQVALHQPA